MIFSDHRYLCDILLAVYGEASHKSFLLVWAIYGLHTDEVLAMPRDRYSYPAKDSELPDCLTSVSHTSHGGDTCVTRMGTPILSDCPCMGADIPRRSRRDTEKEHLRLCRTVKMNNDGDSRPPSTAGFSRLNQDRCREYIPVRDDTVFCPVATYRWSISRLRVTYLRDRRRFLFFSNGLFPVNNIGNEHVNCAMSCSHSARRSSKPGRFFPHAQISCRRCMPRSSPRSKMRFHRVHIAK